MFVNFRDFKGNTTEALAKLINDLKLGKSDAAPLRAMIVLRASSHQLQAADREAPEGLWRPCSKPLLP